MIPIPAFLQSLRSKGMACLSGLCAAVLLTACSQEPSPAKAGTTTPAEPPSAAVKPAAEATQKPEAPLQTAAVKPAEPAKESTATPPAEPAKIKTPQEMFEEQIKKLSPEEFYVTQKSGTERAFTGKYWDHHEEGVYVDVVSGKPLFSSLDKFDSGCGWPSFSKPIHGEEIKELDDRSAGMVRTEVRSATADSHLGHVFDDGPQQLGGLRYCINSAALRFVPLKDLEKEGLGEYRKLFEKKNP